MKKIYSTIEYCGIGNFLFGTLFNVLAASWLLIILFNLSTHGLFLVFIPFLFKLGFGLYHTKD